MAYVKAMQNKAGEVTSHRVRWRLGGARDGDWQSELFDGDEAGAEAAAIFCAAVNEGASSGPRGG